MNNSNSNNNTREVLEHLGSSSDLYKLLRRKEKYSEFIDWTFEEHFKFFKSELAELEEWIKNNDIENIQEEFLDVIYMIWQISNKLNKEWFLDWIDTKKHSEKIYSRSPNLEAWEKISRETEDKVWYILKNKDKK